MSPVKAEWIKPTPYETYLRGVEYAAIHIRLDKPVVTDFPFDSLSKQSQPHMRGVIAQAYGIDLAPRTRRIGVGR
jgi:hypothetical protein